MSYPDKQRERASPAAGLRFSLMLAVVLYASGPLLAPACQSPERSGGPPGYNAAEALKVIRVIDRLKAEAPQPWAGPLRRIEISESELNAYIAYRIEDEHEEIMKVLKLKLFPANKVEGMIHVDLRGQKAPSFLKPEMDVFFAAGLIVENGSIKVDMKKIFVGDEPIQPRVLDMIISISAAVSKTEAKSLSDWYALPYGLKDVKTQKGKALFFY